jgi:hypothetical protein
LTSVTDPDLGSGAFLTPGSRDPGKVKNQAPDPRSGPGGVKTPDDISESLETIFCEKIFKFLDADPGSKMEKIRIRDNPG